MSSHGFREFHALLLDLAILDIKMPEMNGFSFYREIKKLDKNLRICFLTAGEMYYGAYDDIFSSLDAKCLIRKPIENGKLIERINEIIRPISTTERFGIDEA